MSKIVSIAIFAQHQQSFGEAGDNYIDTMTLSDNCCENQDGVVRQGCLYTIMFRHMML